MAELTGPVADRLRAIQEHFDPRMAAELPPHITLVGSSGMGPIPSTTSLDDLTAALDPVVASTAPFIVRFRPAMRFMQSNVVVLPIDPHGPIRALHERIKASGLPFEAPRFTFTPHCTLSFYPEIARARERELLRVRIDEAVKLDAIQAYKAVNALKVERVLDLPLTGTG
jgi:2'-5' RNA ligase